jgi:hypothetical protein
MEALVTLIAPAVTAVLVGAEVLGLGLRAPHSVEHLHRGKATPVAQQLQLVTPVGRLVAVAVQAVLAVLVVIGTQGTRLRLALPVAPVYHQQLLARL